MLEQTGRIATPPFENGAVPPAGLGTRTAGVPSSGAAVQAPPGAAGQPAQLSQTAINALVHLYRGELGRLTAYRSRMDTPTNWAISSSALVSTFALGTAERTHVAFLFLMFINSFFLLLESRRFLSYDVSRQRVQLLERSFFPEVIGLVGLTGDPRWPERLVDALRQPVPTVHYLGAMGWRLRRNYLWIYGGILLTWLGKLHTSVAGDAHADLIDRAGIGFVPGAAVMGVVAVLYVSLAAIAFVTWRRQPATEERRTVEIERR